MGSLAHKQTKHPERSRLAVDNVLRVVLLAHSSDSADKQTLKSVRFSLLKKSFKSVISFILKSTISLRSICKTLQAFHYNYLSGCGNKKAFRFSSPSRNQEQYFC